MNETAAAHTVRHHAHTLGQIISQDISDPLDTILQDIEDFFVMFWQQIVFFGLVFFFILLLSCLVPKVVAGVLRRARISPWSVNLARYTIHAGLILFSVYVVFKSLGATTSILFVGVIAAGFNMGMAPSIGNTVSGVLAQMDDTLQPGRDVQINGQRGIVIDSDLRRVHIFVPDERGSGRNWYIPNAHFASMAYASDAYRQPSGPPAAFLQPDAFPTSGMAETASLARHARRQQRQSEPTF